MAVQGGAGALTAPHCVPGSTWTRMPAPEGAHKGVEGRKKHDKCEGGLVLSGGGLKPVSNEVESLMQHACCPELHAPQTSLPRI